MRQHLIRGRGRPTEVPEHYSQLYLDLDTKQHWIAVGESRVEDWLGPIMNLSDVNQVLTDYANGTGRDAGTVVHMPVVDEAPMGRHITVEVNNRDGRFNVVTDDTSGEAGRRQVSLIIDVKQGLDLGTMFTLLNETRASIELYETHDVFRYAGKPDREIVFHPGNMVNFKLMNVLGTTRYWLVWGDYDKEADTISGRTYDDLVAEFNESFATLEQVDEILVELDDVLKGFLSETDDGMVLGPIIAMPSPDDGSPK